jgi:hypothetical protein
MPYPVYLIGLGLRDMGVGTRFIVYVGRLGRAPEVIPRDQ